LVAAVAERLDRRLELERAERQLDRLRVEVDLGPERRLRLREPLRDAAVVELEPEPQLAVVRARGVRRVAREQEGVGVERRGNVLAAIAGPLGGAEPELREREQAVALVWAPQPGAELRERLARIRLVELGQTEPLEELARERAQMVGGQLALEPLHRDGLVRRQVDTDRRRAAEPERGEDEHHQPAKAHGRAA